MTRRNPSKQIRNRFCFALQEAGNSNWIREGIQRYQEFREAAPELHQAFEEAVTAGHLTEDADFDAMLADAVRAVAARKPGSPAFGNLAARLETPGAARPASYVAPEGAGTAAAPDMACMSSQELQRATLDAFGNLAQVTRRT